MLKPKVKKSWKSKPMGQIWIDIAIAVICFSIIIYKNVHEDPSGKLRDSANMGHKFTIQDRIAKLIFYLFPDTGHTNSIFWIYILKPLIVIILSKCLKLHLKRVLYVKKVFYMRLLVDMFVLALS